MNKIYFGLFIGICVVLCTPVYAVDLTQYCSDGYYKIPNEQVCSRAPGCKPGDAWDYDKLNTSSKMPNPQQCMGDGESGRGGKGCAGYVPLCCYEVARTGDFTKCIGYWERLWCTPSQCNEAKSNGASDGQCGGSCQCGHAFSSYCGNKQPVPIEKRLGGSVQPTSAPTTVPTRIPTPTQIPTRIPTLTPTRIPIPSPTPRISDEPRPTLIYVPTEIPTFASNATTPSPTMVVAPTSSIPLPVVLVQRTEKILQVPLKTYERVMTIDSQIEQTFEGWFGRLLEKIIELSNYQFSK